LETSFPGHWDWGLWISFLMCYSLPWWKHICSSMGDWEENEWAGCCLLCWTHGCNIVGAFM
jgi:hypothetical protein